MHILIQWADQKLSHHDGRRDVKADLPGGEVLVTSEALFGRYGGAVWRPPQGWPFMSTRHFSVRPNGDGAELKDFGSSNGTFVNGQRVSETKTEGFCLLKHGDVIEAAGIKFTVSITTEKPVESPTTIIS